MGRGTWDAVMEREQYDLMYRQEERHWWYVGMRRISAALLDRYHPSGCAARRDRLDILDAGCGSGGMTQFLGRWGRVTGMDLAPQAVELAARRGLPRLLPASGTALPPRSSSF